MASDTGLVRPDLLLRGIPCYPMLIFLVLVKNKAVKTDDRNGIGIRGPKKINILFSIMEKSPTKGLSHGDSRG